MQERLVRLLAVPHRLARRLATVLLILGTTAGSAGAQARMAMTLEHGVGDATELWRVGIQRTPLVRESSGLWRLAVAWELQLGLWRGRSSSGANKQIAEVGITPIVRLVRARSRRFAAFIEGAVGAHLLSRNKVHAGLDMSSAYQFGDHVGAGVQLGDAPVEIVFRHQHLSNASTVQPNHGANFNILRVVVPLPR